MFVIFTASDVNPELQFTQPKLFPLEKKTDYEHPTTRK
jgi:hypothetical protein